jgi:putative phage-type endonuclease
MTTAVHPAFDPLAAPQDAFEAWLRANQKSIGGSSMGALLGIDPFGKTPADLWDGIMGRVPQSSGNRAMDRGHVMEPHIAVIYQARTGRELTPVGRLVHPLFWFLHGSPDRIIRPPAERPTRGVLEIKCHNYETFQRAKREGVNPSYFAQVQHYLDVTGLSWASFALFWTDGWELYWFDVERDDAFIADMRQKAIAFWNDHVLARRRPEGRVAEVLMPPPFIGAEARVIEGDDRWTRAFQTLRSAREQKALAEQAYESASKEVKAMMEEAGLGKVRVPGIGRVNYVESIRRPYDMEQLAREHPEIDLDAYRKAQPVRSLTLYPENVR